MLDSFKKILFVEQPFENVVISSGTGIKNKSNKGLLSTDFFKKRKNLATIGGIIIVLLFVFAYWIPRGECIERIDVRGDYYYDSEDFNTYGQAMDYCLHNRSFLF